MSGITGVISSTEIKERYGISSRTFSAWGSLPGFPRPVSQHPMRYKTPEFMKWAAQTTPEYLPRLLGNKPVSKHPSGRPIRANKLGEGAGLAMAVISLAGYALKQSTKGDIAGVFGEGEAMQLKFTGDQITEAVRFFELVSALDSETLRRFMLGLLAGSTTFMMQRRLGVSVPTRTTLTEKAIRQTLELVELHELEHLATLAEEVSGYAN